MSGKIYNGERAIISLTSWKDRISSCGLTIYSLLTTCPGFHIVLVLSEEEFPQREQSLPSDIQYLVFTKQIELLWVYKNYRSIKKILFTMDRYRDVPIISADDDCIYSYNYADELLSHLPSNTRTCVTYWCRQHKRTRCYNTAGYATCFSPYYFGDAIKILDDSILQINEDDMLYLAIRLVKHIRGCICLNKSYNEVVLSHDETSPLHALYHGRSETERYKLIHNIVSLVRRNYTKYSVPYN